MPYSLTDPDAWTCPRCAAHVEGAGRCQACGFDRLASRSGLAAPAQHGDRCPRCGAAVTRGAEHCDVCGYVPGPPVAPASATWAAQAPVPAPATAPARTPEYDPLRLAMGIAAAIAFGYAGLQLVGLRTISGTTAAEVFYQNVGIMCFGLAALSVAVGLRRT